MAHAVTEVGLAPIVAYNSVNRTPSNCVSPSVQMVFVEYDVFGMLFSMAMVNAYVSEFFVSLSITATCKTGPLSAGVVASSAKDGIAHIARPSKMTEQKFRNPIKTIPQNQLYPKVIFCIL